MESSDNAGDAPRSVTPEQQTATTTQTQDGIPKSMPATEATGAIANEDKTTMRTWRFWAIIISLGITGMASAIEGTIITSALPTITEALGGGDSYVWVPNAYLLASVAVLPLFGQASNIFGRRSLLLGAVALFTLGSGLSGGASSIAMLIAARTVQGLGGGGINLLMETVVTDIVPLRERGKYMSLVMLGSTIGASIGPFLGGLITSNTTWRWCFYLNVPIGGAAFMALFVFLQVNYQRNQTWKQRLARVDFAGNAIFVAAIVAVLLALTWGGTVFRWSTFHIIVPLILGFVGLFLFMAFEWTPKLCPEPSVPRQLVSNRTSAAALVLTFLHAVVTYWAYYFFPIYLQGVKGLSPLLSGVGTLPIFAGSLIFAVVGGAILSKTGRYKPIHLIGWIPLTISFGLFSILDVSSSVAAWVCFQLIWAAGSGILIAILLPAMQAPLDESLVATATGLWSFIRYFGCIWGVTIPSAIFNNECRRLAPLVSNAQIVSDLNGGRAYEYATKAFLTTIEDSAVRDEVIGVFSEALRTVWLVGIAFSGLGFLFTFLEKEVKLRDKLDTEFGMEQEKKEIKGDGSAAGVGITLAAIPTTADAGATIPTK